MIGTVFYLIYTTVCLFLLGAVEKRVELFKGFVDKSNKYWVAIALTAIIMLWPLTIPYGIYLENKK